MHECVHGTNMYQKHFFISLPPQSFLLVCFVLLFLNSVVCVSTCAVSHLWTHLLVTSRMTVQSLGNISGRMRILNTVKIWRRKSWNMQETCYHRKINTSPAWIALHYWTTITNNLKSAGWKREGWELFLKYISSFNLLDWCNGMGEMGDVLIFHYECYFMVLLILPCFIMLIGTYVSEIKLNCTEFYICFGQQQGGSDVFNSTLSVVTSVITPCWRVTFRNPGVFFANDIERDRKAILSVTHRLLWPLHSAGGTHKLLLCDLFDYFFRHDCVTESKLCQGLTDSYGARETMAAAVASPSGCLCCWRPAAASGSVCHSSDAGEPTNMPQTPPDGTESRQRQRGTIITWCKSSRQFSLIEHICPFLTMLRGNCNRKLCYTELNIRLLTSNGSL